MKQFKTMTYYEIIRSALDATLELWHREWNFLQANPDNSIAAYREKIYSAKINELERELLELEHQGLNQKIWHEIHEPKQP